MFKAEGPGKNTGLIIDEKGPRRITPTECARIHGSDSKPLKHLTPHQICSIIGSSATVTLHSNRIGGTSAAMKSKCPQHMTQALGRWAGDSVELYERVDIEDSLHWFSQIANTDVNSAEMSRLVTQQHLPDPVENDAISAIETELRALSVGGG